jgi:hypothetical protein
VMDFPDNALTQKRTHSMCNVQASHFGLHTLLFRWVRTVCAHGAAVPRSTQMQSRSVLASGTATAQEGVLPWRIGVGVASGHSGGGLDGTSVSTLADWHKSRH